MKRLLITNIEYISNFNQASFKINASPLLLRTCETRFYETEQTARKQRNVIRANVFFMKFVSVSSKAPLSFSDSIISLINFISIIKSPPCVYANTAQQRVHVLIKKNAACHRFSSKAFRRPLLLIICAILLNSARQRGIYRIKR